MSEPIFDINSQYQLTDQDRENGWTVDILSHGVLYRLNGQYHDPSPDQPAHRAWYKDGQLANEAHYKEGQLCDPFPKQPAIREWGPNGAIERIAYCQNGKLISETKWYSDGRQTDLV